MEPLKHKLLAEKLQFRNFFRIEYTFFNLIGIDLSAVLSKLVLKRPWITFSTTITACLLIIAMSSYSLNNLDDLDIVCDVLTFIVQSVLATWKAMIIVYKRRELVELLQLIWQEQLRGNPADVDIILGENRLHWRLSSTYCGVTMVTGVMACFLPIFVGLFTYLIAGEFSYLTPFPGDYILDIKHPINYLVVYLANLWGIYLIVLSTISVDCLYSWCVFNVTAHFKVLQLKFEALSDVSYTQDNNVSHIRQSINACIDYHQRAIDVAKLLARTFQPIVLLEFTLNSTELCVIVYQIGRGVYFFKMVFLFLAAATISLQLLLYSYAGQQLENESEECALVCYKSVNWQFWSIRERKLMLLSILRSQRSCKMSAIFFDVNMKIFLWVLRTAASYVTLLWSLVKH